MFKALIFKIISDFSPSYDNIYSEQKEEGDSHPEICTSDVRNSYRILQESAPISLSYFSRFYPL